MMNRKYLSSTGLLLKTLTDDSNSNNNNNNNPYMSQQQQMQQPIHQMQHMGFQNNHFNFGPPPPGLPGANNLFANNLGQFNPLDVLQLAMQQGSQLMIPGRDI